MDSVYSIILMTLVLVSYTILLFTKKNAFWLIWAGLFVLVSILLRNEIDVTQIRDFSAYFDSFLKVKHSTIPTQLLFEPYRLIAFQVVLLFGDFGSLSQITAFYYFHFLVVTAFFLWLAFQEEVTFEVKLILFLAFYPAMAFVWIRAGMGYVATCYLLYAFASGKFRALQFAVPLFHASTIPILLVSKIKDLKLLHKTAILIVAMVAVYFIFESSYAQYLGDKVERYSDTSERRTSLNLILFQIANVLLFIYLAIINPQFRTNFVVLLLMGICVLIYFVNPVMGLRMFPFVLIASIVQRIEFPRFKLLSLIISAGYVPIYYFRFDQIFI
ncbi:MAG: hypothetical protein ABJP34_02870 [Erythrobacter sp.]